MHAASVMTNSEESIQSIVPSRKMTDNNDRYDRRSIESISVLSFKDRFASSFMMNSGNNMKYQQVPKTV